MLLSFYFLSYCLLLLNGFPWLKSLSSSNADISLAGGKPNSSTNSVGKEEAEDNNNDQGGKLYQDHVKREAQNILDGLPLLNFMSSNVLMFPATSINKINPRK